MCRRGESLRRGRRSLYLWCCLLVEGGIGRQQILDVDAKMAGISLRQETRQVLTPAQREAFADMRQNEGVRFVIAGSSSYGRVSRIGC